MPRRVPDTRPLIERWPNAPSDFFLIERLSETEPLRPIAVPHRLFSVLRTDRLKRRTELQRVCLLVYVHLIHVEEIRERQNATAECDHSAEDMAEFMLTSPEKIREAITLLIRTKFITKVKTIRRNKVKIAVLKRVEGGGA